MERTEFSVPALGGVLGGWVSGEGERLLVLHGGPGLNAGYLDSMVDELDEGYRVALFQQRGLAPSTQKGPFTVAQAVEDIGTVLDGLGWERARLVGHSWGGHLALHAAASLGERLDGVLAVDPLGGVGDGGLAHFNAEMTARMPQAARIRAAQLDELYTAGSITDAQLDEARDLFWPSYFARPENATPRPRQWSSRPASDGLWADLVERLPGLEAALPTITVQVGVLAASESPIPPREAAQATVERIPGAWLQLEPGVGHYPWLERSGVVRAAVDRLVGTAPAT